jgi:enoyl-CoA hydratase/carnithine racemase
MSAFQENDDMTVMGSVPTDDDQPSYSTRHDIDEIAQQLMEQVEFMRAMIGDSTDPAEAFAFGLISGTLHRARQALLDLVRDRNATQRALDHFKKAVEDAPHSPGCATEDHRRKYEYPACDCWKSKEAL